MRASLVLKDCRILNVFTGEVVRGDIAVDDGKITGICGEYVGERVIELGGRFVSPGFIEGHIHIESSMLTPSRFAEIVVPRGTTGVVADPHEVANVLGVRGINMFLEESRGLPMDLYLTIPSCVPATRLETSGAEIGIREVEELASEPGIVALGEVMNYPGVIHGEEGVIDKLEAARRMGIPVDGHAPGLRGWELDRYIAAGVDSDHESTEGEEALEKLRKGMWLMIREGSAARNMDAILSTLVKRGISLERCILVSDDRHPRDLLIEGHLDRLVRKAVGMGVGLVDAVRMVSWNPARRFRLRGVGAIAPGFKAHLTVLSEDLKVELVLFDGVPVAEMGRLRVGIPDYTYDPEVYRTVRLARELKPDDFKVPVGMREGSALARVMGVMEGSIVTKKLIERLEVKDGVVEADPDRDILKAAVVERHRASGRIGLGFVKGFGLKGGALASTVAHDSHNLIVVGVDDESMAAACNHLAEMGGGLSLAQDGRIISSLRLEVAGLMAGRGADVVADGLEMLHQECRKLGCTLSSPFMAMSFLSLPVIPELKLTDMGLVEGFRIVSLFLEHDESRP
ncbi:adenine deaminase [Candidatus Bathyarchaeota archaeon]|nr:adenine deaminase [Candidatus Bathyarchaeota archaeon]